MRYERQQVELQPAYVLHRRPYGESSAILELLTPEYGRIGLVAKGVLSGKSKRKGLLQPFYPLLVSWVGRGGDLGTLTKVEAQGTQLNIIASELMVGFYLNELIYRLLVKDEINIELFSCYDETLRNLAIASIDENSSYSVQAVLRRFEVQLLKLLGFGLILDHDAVLNRPIMPDVQYDYQIDFGPIASSTNSLVKGVLISGKTLISLSNQIPNESLNDFVIMNDAKRLLRYVLNHYLGEKALISRELYQKITPLDKIK